MTIMSTPTADSILVAMKATVKSKVKSKLLVNAKARPTGMSSPYVDRILVTLKATVLNSDSRREA